MKYYEVQQGGKMFLFISKPDFSCNPHALWQYIIQNTNHETAWLVSNKKNLEILRNRGICCELYDTIRGNELVSQAKYIISNVYVFSALPKKEGQVFINLWHGSGIKAHDFYDVHLPLQQLNKVLDFSEKTDLLCVHSLDDRFRLAAQLHYDMRKAVVTGQPRLDCMKKTDGKEKLAKVLGKEIKKYSKFIFFVPSFRANSSCHSGKFYSENVFRLDDFDDEKLRYFLEENNAALIYKLHPVEQTALKGVEFFMNESCYEITDDMLFESDVRYNEFLNAFDVMISDYSSIAFDFLVLDRPIVYLIPDYNEYKSEKGFVFHNINYYMPGEKVYDFMGLLNALKDGLEKPEKYSMERKRVIEQRFDYCDDRASERCYHAIKRYCKPSKGVVRVQKERLLPSSAQMLKKYLPKSMQVIDSTREVSSIAEFDKNQLVLYITEELPDEYRSISRKASTDIADLSFFYKVKKMDNVKIELISGGVEYKKFALLKRKEMSKRLVIGFAGVIDCRIYFAMVQYICEAFPQCDIVFAGDIFGEYPAWLDGYENLQYLGQVSYENLPEVIQSFDVAILPFYGEYQKRVPNELFQYLASGKQVIASDMSNLPECNVIYRSRSVADAVKNVRKALECVGDKLIEEETKRVALAYDWGVIAQEIIKDIV